MENFLSRSKKTKNKDSADIFYRPVGSVMWKWSLTVTTAFFSFHTKWNEWVTDFREEREKMGNKSPRDFIPGTPINFIALFSLFVASQQKKVRREPRLHFTETKNGTTALKSNQCLSNVHVVYSPVTLLLTSFPVEICQNPRERKPLILSPSDEH